MDICGKWEDKRNEEHTENLDDSAILPMRETRKMMGWGGKYSSLLFWKCDIWDGFRHSTSLVRKSVGIRI